MPAAVAIAAFALVISFGVLYVVLGLWQARREREGREPWLWPPHLASKRDRAMAIGFFAVAVVGMIVAVLLAVR